MTLSKIDQFGQEKEIIKPDGDNNNDHFKHQILTNRYFNQMGKYWAKMTILNIIFLQRTLDHDITSGNQSSYFDIKRHFSLIGKT